ncbi:response regulator of the LytR/AlgR family [Owenweeksia hongkongensis DSM 17368]|uniref:Response regulator of the LytR/AlgR family n=1 Tax=Owenweeksia hongkongensis (strain DSM 17368 / CIP 108786 / JCM 12287 / NRRL B-23963 / UST20020801) TaxID=926562 RepID=G8R7U8_OWEHD|nr:LytTR family DNA-binding domain-containing protein [Owenweeksia hongkongensis]AEV33479.1 response regulator of the LytR/AlgR family [Owenweeksia hongkongensis DSM 17368]
MDCIIIEDQAPAQRVLKKYIADIGTLSLKGTFNSAIPAVEFLAKEKVDLIFLDIHLPKISGMDFLKTLAHPPAVIFTTAFSDYAVQSYEMGVVDYLVKPFSFERFLKAVAKVNSVSVQIASAADESHDFYIKSGYEYIKVNSEDVIFIQSDMDYTEVNLATKKLLSPETLQNWEQKLAGYNFIRVHKSYLINASKIEKIAGNQVFLSEGFTAPIGRAYKEDFLARVVK